MKRVLFIILVCLFIFVPVSAIMFPEQMQDQKPAGTTKVELTKGGIIDEPPVETIPIETLPVETIAPEPTPEPEYRPARVLSNDLIEAIEQVIGIAPRDESIAVYYDGTPIAVISPESPLNGRDITPGCLKFGYATDNWDACEIRVEKYGDYVQLGAPDDINPNRVAQ